MEPGSTTDTRYISMAEDALHTWIADGDEPEGTLWDLYCDLAGVDAEAFAAMVRYQRRKGNKVRLRLQIDEAA